MAKLRWKRPSTADLATTISLFLQEIRQGMLYLLSEEIN
jgi:hypothetical protein